MSSALYIFSISGLLNAIIALAYGFFVFFKKKKDPVATVFLYMSVSLALWGVSYWQWLLAVTPDSARLWINYLNIGSFFIPVFYYHWVLSLLNIVRREVRIVLYVAYAIATLGSLCVNTSLVVSGIVSRLYFDYWPSAGPVYSIVILLLYFFLVGYAQFLVFSALRQSTSRSDRLKFLFLIIGSAIGFGGGLTNFFLWYDIMIPPYGTFLVALFPLIFGYATVRHQLFNTRALFAELLVFLILSILLLELLLSTTRFEFIFRTIVFIFVVTLSAFLVRSVYREVNNREKNEQLARYLANANARLRELDRQKTEFVSIASHQLRAPVAAIRGYTSLVVEGVYGEVPEKFNEPLGRIVESGRRLALMIDDFLNVSRIEQGRMSYHIERLNLGAIIETIFAEHRLVGEQKGLVCTYTNNTDSPVWIMGDEGKLKQILSNIVDNAIKYTQKGSVNVSLHRIDTHRSAMVEVQDTGIGISPEEQDQLFHKFKRASNANDANVYGTGLGLYIAKEIVRAHNGWIHVASSGVGKGSKFSIELPIALDTVE